MNRYLKRNITNRFISFALTLSFVSTNVSFPYAQETNGNAISIVDETVSGTSIETKDAEVNAYEATSGSYVLFPGRDDQSWYYTSDGIRYADGTLAYGANGGYIYFNPQTNTITGCDNTITKAIIPEKINGYTVLYIGKSAFSGCTLSEISIPSSVQTIYEEAFSGVEGLKKLIIPSNVRNIEYDAFGYCPDLEELIISEGVMKISKWAFYDCGKLKEVTIPSTVVSLGDNPFYSCSAIEKFSVSPNNKYYYSDSEGILFQKENNEIIAYPCGKKDTKYVVADNVERIGAYSFATNRYLEEVEIKEGCRIIDEYAFGQCFSLNKITIPHSVSMIDETEGGTSVFGWRYSPANGWGVATIYGYINSQAKFYADKMGMPFVSLGTYYVSEKNGYFTYAADDKNYRTKYYYDDRYFKHPASNYDPNLATMSLCLAMSAFAHGDNGTDYTNKSQNVKDLLVNQLGFDNYQTNNKLIGGYDNGAPPTNESIGVAVASKPFDDNGTPYTLIAVAVRGANYEREWASNFTIKEEGQAYGFSQAKDNVLSFLSEYVADNNISGNVKIWITGFSRAAATSNLVAGTLDDKTPDDKNVLGNNTELNKNNIYAYCFETPMGAEKSKNVHSEKYNNIFNIINPNDLVPRVAMSKWGFDRYGVDKILPSLGITDDYEGKNGIRAQMLKQLAEIPDASEYVVDNFEGKKLSIANALVQREFGAIIKTDKNNKVSQSIFLDEFINTVTTDYFPNRYGFHRRIEDGLTYILDVYFGLTKAQSKKAVEYFTKDDKWKEIVANVIFDVYDLSSNDRMADIKYYLKIQLENSISYAGADYSDKEMKEAVNALCDFLVPFIIDNPDMVATLAGNIKGIGQAHFPSLCLAWMRAMDENYTNTPIKFISGKYRVVKVNCPIDFEVYDVNGDIVAKVENNTPKEIEDSSIIASINDNGEKIVYLPADSEYEIKLTATETGEMNYSVNEYDPNIDDYSRIVNYYNIPVLQGETLYGDIPEYNSMDIESIDGEGSLSTYSLKTEENILEADLDISGQSAASSDFSVNVSSNNDKYGIVTGGGTVSVGSFVRLEAIPYDGYLFKGWYEDDQCVSTDSEYRFIVTEDNNIVGVFEADPNKVTETTTETTTKSTSRSSGGGGGGGGGGGSVTATYTVKFESNGGSKITSQSVKKNETVSEPTKPTKKGYEFTGWYTDSWCLDKYSFSTKVTKSFTLYAGWKKETSDVIEEKPTEPDTTSKDNTTEPALNNTVRVTIGNKAVSVGYSSYEMDVAPYIQASSNSTLVPLRFVTIAVSGGDLNNADRNSNIAWNAETKTATILANNRTIKFTAGSNIVNVDGKDYSMDYGVTAEITDNRMFIPFRALGTVLGVDVDWDTETKTAIYKNH